MRLGAMPLSNRADYGAALPRERGAMKVLYADDDAGMRALVRRIVADAGYEFVGAVNGREALERFSEERPDLVVLDVMMPDLNGYEVCERIRARASSVPVLFLTAKGDIVDKSIGFNAGADDFLVKPFNAQELALRMKALLRRRGQGAAEAPMKLMFDGLEIDMRTRKVVVRGRSVDLTPKEFHLLQLLATHPGEVFTRERLTEEIWGADYIGETAGVAVLVHRLRDKIEPDPVDPVHIQTVWRVGYRFGD